MSSTTEPSTPQTPRGATINGRLLARNAEVTLDSNTITNSACNSTTTTTTTTAPATTATTAAVTPTVPRGGLPRTGKSSSTLLLIALGLAAAGVTLTAARRRHA